MLHWDIPLCKDGSFYISGYLVRQQMVDGLREYLFHGRPLGGFLQAVVSNDLVESLHRADEENYQNIQAFASLLYLHMPRVAWGSKEAYEKWVAMGGIVGADFATEVVERGPDETEE